MAEREWETAVDEEEVEGHEHDCGSCESRDHCPLLWAYEWRRDHRPSAGDDDIKHQVALGVALGLEAHRRMRREHSIVFRLAKLIKLLGLLALRYVLMPPVFFVVGMITWKIIDRRLEQSRRMAQSALDENPILGFLAGMGGATPDGFVTHQMRKMPPEVRAGYRTGKAIAGFFSRLTAKRVKAS